jgi:hypothetical protein
VVLVQENPITRKKVSNTKGANRFLWHINQQNKI